MHGLACQKLGLHVGEATWFCLCGFSECLCIPICTRSETVLEMFFWDCLQELLCNFLCMDFVPLPACNYFFYNLDTRTCLQLFFFYTSPYYLLWNCPSLATLKTYSTNLCMLLFHHPYLLYETSHVPTTTCVLRHLMVIPFHHFETS